MQKYRKFIVRVYRQFDLDLLYLCEALLAEHKSPQHLFRAYLKAAVRGEKVPEQYAEWYRNLSSPPPDFTINPMRIKRQVQILLDKEKDADIIQWIEQFTPGYFNMAIKAAIRTKFDKPCYFPCLAKTQLKFVR